MHYKALWSWWIDASFLHLKFDASLSCFSSHRERMLVRVNKNNESWKKLNWAQTFAERLEKTFIHTWLNKIKQNDYVKSSFSNLWIKCTLVHTTFHAQWKHSPKGAAAFYSLDNHFLTEFLFSTTPKSSQTPCEVNEGWRGTWATTINVLLRHVSVHGRNVMVFFQKQPNQGLIPTNNVHVLKSSIIKQLFVDDGIKMRKLFFLFLNFALPSL